MGQHFYYKKGDKILLSKSVDTPAKARKSKTKVYPSVTTILSYMPSPFVADWKDREIVRLARENPEKDYKELQDLRWGTRIMPSGEEVSSSEFGTAVHEQVELATLALIEGVDYHCLEWAQYYRPFLRWLEAEKITPIAAEYKVASDRYNTAGTIDGVGRKEGRVILWDFKTRSGENLKTKTYDKDAAQLAVEADIIREDWELGYTPRIYTILICADTGTCVPKLWTEAAQKKGLTRFDCLSRFFAEWEGLLSPSLNS